MQYDGLAWAIALLAALVLWVALRVLVNSSWFLGWLRGTCGLAFWPGGAGRADRL